MREVFILYRSRQLMVVVTRDTSPSVIVVNERWFGELQTADVLSYHRSRMVLQLLYGYLFNKLIAKFLETRSNT
jgi:hypothetical protein